MRIEYDGRWTPAVSAACPPAAMPPQPLLPGV